MGGTTPLSMTSSSSASLGATGSVDSCFGSTDMPSSSSCFPSVGSCPCAGALLVMFAGAVAQLSVGETLPAASAAAAAAVAGSLLACILVSTTGTDCARVGATRSTAMSSTPSL